MPIPTKILHEEVDSAEAGRFKEGDMKMDLKFVQSEDMLKELQTRFDEMIFLGAAQRTRQTEDLTISFSGSYHACVGLVELGRLAIQSGGSTDEDYTD